ncbi:hypothetical protein O7622_16200 [Micromonospora sp. WMMD1076]|uniref:hypothetical protein n=1 Tax=Micromonospora sp. WMMD1076 TaxID=3016103 RepID=UPI00249B9992|nr:hypothetical protein [Micromonospora sp. WMMD1076]WFF04625.1 hypothetical protein O7622_16200 [Micromonospora sp. WMMD1076]
MQTAPQSRRDGGITALVEGFFAASWFGWGQADPPAWLTPWLTVGSIAALLVAAVGAVVGFTSPASTAAINNRAAGRRYGIIVGVEFALAGLGAALLGVLGLPAYIPVWICAVVGVHFLPLTAVLRDRNLIALGVLLTATAVAALIAGLATAVAPSTVTGVGAGLFLSVFGAVALVGALRQPRPRPQPA